MNIDIPHVTDKKINKLIYKINSIDENDKKAESTLQKLIETLVNSSLKILSQWDPSDLEDSEDLDNETNIFLYLISLLCEENSDVLGMLDKKDLSVIQRYYNSKSEKQRINSISIIGFYLIDYLNSEQDNYELSELEDFLSQLEDENTEVRYNISLFMEQFPKNAEFMKEYYFSEFDNFIEYFSNEDNPEVLKSLNSIIQIIQPQLSLSQLITFINKLIFIYKKSKWSLRNEMIREMIGIEIPSVKNLPENVSKDKVLKIIENRIPLARKIYIQENSIENDDVSRKMGRKRKDKLPKKVDKSDDDEELELDDSDLEEESESEEKIGKSSENEDNIYSFSYVHNKNKYKLVFEKKKLLKYFSNIRQDTNLMLKDFKKYGIADTSILSVLIKKLVKEREIKGFLSKNYWYPYNYLYEQITKRLNQNGSIVIKEYVDLLGDAFFNLLLAEISNNDSFRGVFDKDHKKYTLLRKITEKIKNTVTSTNVFDLNTYKNEYKHEDFLDIEQYAKNFFTPFHQGHTWLTNLGKTRIEMYLEKTANIGIFDYTKAVNELKVPQEIISKVLKGEFSKRNGYWDLSEHKFYYSKVIKREILNIQKYQNPEEQEIKINELAKRLNLDKEVLSSKIDKKLLDISKDLSSKDKISITAQLSNLQLNYNELIEFVNSMEKPYLILRDEIIFDQELIMRKKEGLKEKLEKEVGTRTNLDINVLSKRYKCANSLVLEILNELIAESKLTGMWLNDMNYLTDNGIKSKMINNKGYLDLNSFIIDRSLNIEEIEYFEEILYGLIQTGMVKGVYDKNTSTFTSEDFKGESDIENEKDKFLMEINPHLKDINLKYLHIKEILMNYEITPTVMDEIEETLDAAKNIAYNTDNLIKKIINISNKKLGKKFKEVVISNREGEKVTRFEDMDDISDLLVDYKNWKQLIVALDQKAPKILYLKKMIGKQANVEENKRKLNEILEYIGFL